MTSCRKNISWSLNRTGGCYKNKCAVVMRKFKFCWLLRFLILFFLTTIISSFSTRLKAIPMAHMQSLINFDSMAMQIFSLQVP